MRRFLAITAALAFSAFAVAACTTGPTGYTEGSGSSVPPQGTAISPGYYPTYPGVGMTSAPGGPNTGA